MDPLSVSASIAGLIALAQTLLPILAGYETMQGYPKEFTALVREMRSLSIVLDRFQPILQRLEKGLDSSKNCTTILSRLICY
jgi:hypothetical protein